MLDEPVSALDLSAGAGAQPASDLQDEFQLTYVFISHDLLGGALFGRQRDGDVLRRARSNTAPATKSSNPQHAYTKVLFAATPRADVSSIKARLAKEGATRTAASHATIAPSVDCDEIPSPETWRSDA